jgi:hypothetical protein
MAKAPKPQEIEADDHDPLNPAEDTPSDLDDRTHAEFLAIYRDASENLRFAKDHQWRMVLYFSIGAAAATAYGEWSNWGDGRLGLYLLGMIWVFSFASVGVIVCLQWWQGAESQKIAYITSKWSSFSTAARRRKSNLMSDIQRYGMLVAMILYLELVTIAVTRIFWAHI